MVKNPGRRRLIFTPCIEPDQRANGNGKRYAHSEGLMARF
jgi:hypothetical protein